MPTIIDTLILELELDPKNFSDNARRSIVDMRALESQADRSAKNVGQNTGALVENFFNFIRRPAETAHQHLVSLSDQSRRTGAAVSAGAAQGASGIAALAAAGLAAFGALKLVQDIYKEVIDSSHAGAALGRMANQIGTTPHWMASVAAASRMAVHGDPQTVLGDLFGLSTDVQVWAQGHFGQMPGRLQALSRIGIPITPGDSPEQILDKIATYLHAHPGGAAVSDVTAAGLSPDLVRFLAQPNSRQLIGQAGNVSLTDHQAQVAKDVEQATDKLYQHYDQMWNLINERLGPSLVHVIELMTNFADLLGRNADLVVAFLTGILHLIPGGLGWILGNKPGATGPAPTHGFSGNTAIIQPGPGTAAMATRLGNLTADDIAIMQRESGGNPNIGYTPPGSPPNDLSKTPLDKTGFPNWSGAMGPQGWSWAAGLWQITKTNWHKYAPALGIHDFSPESQLRVRRAMQQAARAGGRDPNVDWGGTPPGSTVVPPAATDALPSSLFGQKERGGVFGQLGIIQQHGPAPTHGFSGNTANITVGDIHIHTQAKDAGAIAGEIGHAVRRNLANQSNRGLN